MCLKGTSVAIFPQDGSLKTGPDPDSCGVESSRFDLGGLDLADVDFKAIEAALARFIPPIPEI